MKRIIVVSNWLPFLVKLKEKNINLFSTKGRKGGFIATFSRIYKSKNILWIGSPGVTKEETKGLEGEIKSRLRKENCYPVFIPQKDFEGYFFGFSNKTIWPLFHYFPEYAFFNEEFWSAYKKVNELFCEIVLSLAKPEDIIWIHNFHLMLLPELIREKYPTANIGFFLHIPFPNFEIFRLLPQRKEILKALTKADLIGFHTYSYTKHFLESVHHLLGYECSFNNIKTENRICRVNYFPMGIDCQRFTQVLKNEKVKKNISKIKKEIGERTLILSIDRLDYTKGICQRLKAFNLFLSQFPQFRKNVTLFLVVVPSGNQNVKEYQALKKEIEQLVSEINGKYGTLNWIPVHYFYRPLSFELLCALYLVADVALLTPLRDGMNLIAKEFLISSTEGKGALILSETAGVAEELVEAIIVNPNNVKEIALAIKEALTMPEEEQKIRNIRMQARIKRYDIYRWQEDFMKNLEEIKALQKELEIKLLTPQIEKEIIREYRNTKKHLFLLDFDKSLFNNTKEIERNKEFLKLMEDLSQEPQNEVVILSERDKKFLERIFGKLEVSLVAENGLWIKEKNSHWKISQHLNTNWKDEIRPIVQRYVDITPGSFIEEKDFSLLWNCQKVLPELRFFRKKQLEEELSPLVRKLNLEVFEEGYVIEIRDKKISKKEAVLRWLGKENWNFILSIGEGKANEEIFEILPVFAFSIKIGFGVSKAKFNLPSFKQVLSLLRKIEYSF